MKTSLQPLICNEADPAMDALRAAFAAPVAALSEVPFMPAGLQTITPSQGGKPVVVQVLVERGAVAALEAQRKALTAKGTRPYFDFNHEDGPASFWPEEFIWREGPQGGVYARGTWTTDGEAAVVGKSYRQFSPVFFVDDTTAKPARIINGFDKPRAVVKPNMGGLVNDPAFKSIPPFWAKNSSGDAAGENQNQNQNADNMNEQELAALRAKNQELQKDLDALRSKDAALKAKNETDATIAAELRAKEAEIKANNATLEVEALKAKTSKLEADAKTRADADADAAVKAAVARGAIAAKDDALQAKWKAAIIADPTATELLASIPNAPALGGRIIPAVNGEEGRIHVGQISARDAVKAYGELMAKQRGEGVTLQEKQALAREAGLIFCRDLKAGSGLDDMPVSGSNSLGTLVGTLITQRTLELLKIEFPMLNRVTTDFSAESVNYNQAVTTRVITPPTVGTYNTTTGYAQTDVTATDVSVTINRHKHVQTTLNANNLGGTARNLFEEFAPANAYAIAKEMVDHVYGLILAAGFTNTATIAALADFSRASVIDMGTQLTINGNPHGARNRTLLLYSTFFGKLAQDAAIVSLAAFQKAGIITDGELPDVHGFAVSDAPNLPGNSENLVGFGFSKSALVIAARLPQDYAKVLPGASFGNVTVVTNPDNGFSTMHVEYVNHDLGTANCRDAWMYGDAVGQALAGQRLTSA